MTRSTIIVTTTNDAPERMCTYISWFVEIVAKLFFFCRDGWHNLPGIGYNPFQCIVLQVQWLLIQWVCVIYILTIVRLFLLLFVSRSFQLLVVDRGYYCSLYRLTSSTVTYSMTVRDLYSCYCSYIHILYQIGYPCR